MLLAGVVGLILRYRLCSPFFIVEPYQEVGISLSEKPEQHDSSPQTKENNLKECHAGHHHPRLLHLRNQMQVNLKGMGQRKKICLFLRKRM